MLARRDDEPSSVLPLASQHCRGDLRSERTRRSLERAVRRCGVKLKQMRSEQRRAGRLGHEPSEDAKAKGGLSTARVERRERAAP